MSSEQLAGSSEAKLYISAGNLSVGCVLRTICPLKVDAIGGLTRGADPIARATAPTSYQKGGPINAFSVRQRPKDHGTGGVLVGDVTLGDRAVVVEDVVTTGGWALKAVAAAWDFRLTVVKVLILADRQEGGKEAVEKEVPEVEAVFTISELR